MTTYNPKLQLHTEADALRDLTFNKKEDCAEKMSKLFREARDLFGFDLDDAHDYAVLKHLDRDHPDADDPITTPEQERAQIAEAVQDSEYADQLETILAAFDKFVAWGISPHLAMSSAVNPLRIQLEDKEEKRALDKIEKITDPTQRHTMREAFLRFRVQGADIQEAIIMAGLEAMSAEGPTGRPPQTPPPTAYLN